MLQPATLSDLTEVASWITSARDCELWAGGRVRFPIYPASLPEEIGFREANAFSLFEGERLIAFGQLIPKCSNRGHLATLIVAPSARRRGFGEKLVRGLLTKARQAGFERVSLYVDETNVAALALYKKLAFRDVPTPSGDRPFATSRYMEHHLLGRSIASRTALA